MIAAVIVTYNRKELLGENIRMIQLQTQEIDKVFIVDNCSTDGTYEYLKSNNWADNDKFIYIKTKANIGGAGGFYTGTKAAYEYGADWVVLMDDDGRMSDKNTMKNLYIEAVDLYRQNYGNKKIFINSLVQQGDMLSFKMGNKYTVKEAIECASNGLIDGEANPFNGTMLSKELIGQIGYPNKEFFIKGDEVNYKQRSFDAGAYVGTAINSRYIHPRPETHEKKVLGKKVPFFVEAPWKEYYAARNFTYMYKQKGWYKAILFELIYVKILAILSMECKKGETIKMLFKGVYDGWKGKLGATVRP